MQNHRKSVLLGSVALAGLVMMPGSVLAQDATSSGGATGVETVVVTAQRREESAQKVPIAITAVSSDDLKAMGVDDTRNLTAAVPGLVMTSTGNITQVFLRGVGTTNTSAGDENSTAIYVDGVYHGAGVGAMFAFNNIKSIEVDKGPQGTLFGRNATGGVVQIITKDPSQDAHMDVSTTYASFDTWRGSLYATGGITDNLSADIAVYGNTQGKGWGRNIYTGRDVNLTKEYAVRSKWKLDLGQNTTIRLSADYDYNSTDVNTTTRIIPPARLIQVPGFPTVYPGYYNANSDIVPHTISRTGGVALKIDHDLHWADLRSITSWRRSTGVGALDQDSGPVPIVYISVPSYSKTWTQEFQLLSSTDSWLKWIGGLYYYDDNSGYNRTGVQAIGASGPLFTTFSNIGTKSYAVYGQANAEVLPKTKLTVGLRYTSDKRSLTSTRILGSGVVDAGYPLDTSHTFKKLTYRFALDYQLTDDVLAYVSYTRGFKGGLFNSISPFLPGTLNVNIVQPEVLDSLEGGVKSDWFDNRLRVNASVFHYVFNNIQIAQIIPGGSVVRNAASAHINGVDLEMDATPIRNLQLHASLEYLDAKFDSFPNAPFYTILPGGGDTVGTGDASGNYLPHAPKWTASILAQYAIETGIGPVQLQASYYYNDGYFFGPDNRLPQSSYSLVGAGIYWMAENGKWDVRLWGKNLTGARYLGYASQATTGDHGAAAEPRTLGVTVGLHL